MTLLMASLVSLLAIPFLLVWILYNAMQNKWQATSVRRNTIEVVFASGEPLEVLANVPDYVVTEKNLIKRKDELETKIEDGVESTEEYRKVGWFQTWLRERWGFWWVSIFYPIRAIAEIEIIKARLVTRTEVPEEGSILARIKQDPKPVKVKFLLHRIPRPFGFTSVELADRLQINIVVMCLFEVVDPIRIITTYEKDLFRILEAAIAVAILDVVKSKKFSEFVTMPKGVDSPFATEVKKINYAGEDGAEGLGMDSSASTIIDVEKIMDDSRFKEIHSEGLQRAVGVRLINISIEDYELSEDKDGEIQKATTALEVARLNGAADVAKARLELHAERLRARAFSARVRELAKQYGGGERGYELANKQLVAESMGNGNLRTYVEGGGRAGTLISTDQGPDTPPKVTKTPN